MQIDSLVIRLGLDPKGVADGMKKAEAQIHSGLRSIYNAMTAPLKSALAGLSAGEAISAYTSTAVQLDALSKSLNMSMEDLQGWQYAAEQAGAEAEEVGNFFRDFSDYIVDATTFDSGPLKEIAENLGISLKDAQGNVKKTTDVVLELADSFQKIDPQKAVAFGMQLSLDPGMIQLLQKGRGEIEGLIKAQKELGGYTKEDAEIAGKAQLAFSTLTKAFQSAGMGIARVLVPIMQKAAEVITKVVVFLREHSPFVKAVFTGIAAVISGMLVPSLLRLKAAMTAIMMNPLTLFLTGLAAIIVGLGLLFDDLYAYVTGGNSALADFWSIFGTGEEIAQSLSEAWEDLKAIGIAAFAALTSAGKALWENFRPVFTAFGEGVKGLLKILKGLFTGDFSTLADGIKGLFSGIVHGLTATLEGAAKTIWQALTGIFSRLVPFVSSAASRAANALSGWFKESVAKLGALITGLADRIPSIGEAAQAISGFFESAASTVSGLFTSAVSTAISTLSGVADSIFGAFSTAFTKIQNFIATTFDAIGATITGIFDSVVAWISGKFQSLVSSISGWFSGIFDSIPGLDWVKDKLGIGGGSDEEKPAEGAPAPAAGASTGGTGKPGVWPPEQPALKASQPLRPVTADTGGLAAHAGAAQNKTEVKATSTVHTGPITINANPANAQGIATGLNTELGKQQWKGLPYSAQSGVLQK